MFFWGPNVPQPYNAKLKFIFKNNEVGIFGNPEGLKYLGQLCLQLSENPKTIGHIHLDKSVPKDTLLTEDSLIAFIAILEENGKK